MRRCCKFNSPPFFPYNWNLWKKSEKVTWSMLPVGMPPHSYLYLYTNTYMLLPIPIHQNLYATLLPYTYTPIPICFTHTYTPIPIRHTPTLYIYTDTYMPRSYLIPIHQYIYASLLTLTYTPIHICSYPYIYTSGLNGTSPASFFKLSTNVSTKLP